MGASHSNDKSTAHSSKVPAGSLKFHTPGKSGGFGSFTVTPTTFIARQHDGDGTLLWTAPTRAPRSLTPAPAPPPGPPAPTPTPTPTPPPRPAPAGVSWECHEGMTVDLHKLPLQDHDLKSVGKQISSCEDKCATTSSCVAILWHETDHHCHTLSGAPPTQLEFAAALKKGKQHQACLLVTK